MMVRKKQIPVGISTIYYWFHDFNFPHNIFLTPSILEWFHRERNSEEADRSVLIWQSSEHPSYRFSDLE